MADIVSAFCAVFQGCQTVFECISRKAANISKFDENFDNLNTALGDLQAKRDDLSCNVAAEEIKGKKQLAQVKRWRSNVQAIETSTVVAEASALEQRRSKSCGCCSNIISTYRSGKKLPRMLSKVRRLLSTGSFDVVAAPASPSVVVVLPVQQTFGLDEKLESTWKLLMDAGTRMLGLYGMGGVGKTTLLSLIAKNFIQVKDDFDVVIWVKLCKDADIGKIQDDIGKRLGLYDENWCQKPERERASDIHRVLKDNKPRFVLLLDDLWEEVSLATIGIPLQGREYKVVLTTRFKDVSGSMGANQDIEVECLGKTDAWDLFKLKSRCGGLSEEICDIAKEIAGKCCGLPLALEVIGKSLASKTLVDEWRRAFNTLDSSPSELKGTEKGLFEVLKLSYDYLEKEEAKLCFQYCALFPKAYNITRDELVEYWICEGIIDEEDGRKRAKDRGCDIIDTLVEAGLLLKDGDAEHKMYMHDMIRGLALGIVSEITDGKKYVVKTDAGLLQLPNVTDWAIVTKMSVMNNEIESISDDLEFPAKAPLITMFLQKNKLVNIVGEFFVVMSTLVVLDLSWNLDITTLPDDISVLGCLRYLSLLRTGIKDLPSGIGFLTQLIHLDLEATSDLQSISLVVSKLLNLQVLRFYESKAPLDHLLLKTLERLKWLETLTITVKEDDVLTAFLTSNLVGCTQGLFLEGLDEVSGVSGKSFVATFGGILVNLSKLEMTDCNIIETEAGWGNDIRDQYSPSNPIIPSNTWFKNLKDVVLLSCVGLKDVTWLIYAANLESLSVESSPMMEELISEEKAAGVHVEPFLKLQVLDLAYLNELESIYWGSLSFPRLQKVDIKHCPKLCKLPLNSTSVDRIDDLRIQVEQGWLQGVQWENGAKERFSPFINMV